MAADPDFAPEPPAPPPGQPGHRRDLSSRYGVEAVETACRHDQFEAVAEGAYWIRVRWSFCRATIARAETALGTEWHGARPVVRLWDASSAGDRRPAASRCIRDVEVHGDVDHWYIPVPWSGRSYRLQIGYRTRAGRFHPLAASRLVRTPLAGSGGKSDRCSKKQTGRGTSAGKSGARAAASVSFTIHRRRRQAQQHFEFLVDAELIVHGATDPCAELTVLGEAVELSKEGRFSLRYSLPNGRLVVPIHAVTPCGREQHTIVLAIERNTRQLEPQPTDELTIS